MDAPPAVTSRARLSEIQALFEAGAALQAHDRARLLGPLQEWRGEQEEILAGRLAMVLGAARTGLAIHLAAGRRHRSSALARYYYACALFARLGPLRAWRLLSREELDEPSPEIRADWLALHGLVLAHFRDFTEAEHWLQRAEACAASEAWIAVQRSHVYELQDRYGDALTQARRALSLRPFYRPAVIQAVDVLLSLGRADESLDLLENAMDAIECDAVAARLAVTLIERGALDRAQDVLGRLEELTPLRDRRTDSWLAMRRAEIAWRRGDAAGAVAHARATGTPAGARMAERIESAAGPRTRRTLDVPFVQQHHLTCAPATLASLGRFFARPVDHLALAEEIEYGGTPGYKEREWATRNGWTVREFRVTWDVVVSLIDRGFPFGLVTVAPTSAHEQAVVGYDAGLHLVIVRDPNSPLLCEHEAEALLRANASSGPRGLLVIPTDRLHEVAGVDLPDAEIYDQLHALQLALLAHDRDAAEGICAHIRRDRGDDRLAWVAALNLADYDADPVRMLEAVDAQLRLFPGAPHLLLSRFALLRDLGREQELLAALEEQAADPAGPPVFLARLAGELRRDGREWPRARALITRALARHPTDAQSLAVLADLSWDQGDRGGAAQAYRFAACLDDRHEGYFRALFSAARHLGHAAEVLAFLDERFDELGDRSSQPARTLFNALADLDRPRDGFSVLERALERRPDDGDLRLFAADAFGRHGDFDRARQMLEAARSRTRPASWLRTAAGIARYGGQFAEALAFWKQVIQYEPLSMDAHSEVVELLSMTAGRAQAFAHLVEAVARFPHSLPLLRLEVEWADGPEVAEPLLAHLIDVAPRDAWARVERSRALLALDRADEAVAEGELAVEIEPASAGHWTALGETLERCGRSERAHEAFRRATELWLDAPGALPGLCRTAPTPVAREGLLSDLEAQLRTRLHSGTGLFAFCEEAGKVWRPETLRSSLESLLQERGELWCVWSALVRHRLEHTGAKTALPLALEATERFPLVAKLWLQLADVHRARQDPAAELEAAERAARMAPGWSAAVRRVAEAYREAGRLDASCELLEGAVAREPGNAVHHGCLADDLWALGHSDRALHHARTALAIDPAYEWAWNALRRWCSELGRPDPAPALARDLVGRRAGDPRAWQTLAKVLQRKEDLVERLAALERAIALDPRNEDLYDLKATVLAEAHRYEEAERALTAAPFDGKLVFTLQGRAAWLLAERGDLRAAVERMEAVVTEHPGYYWGVTRLAEWHRSLGNLERSLAASRRLVELAPADPHAFGYRGAAHFDMGRRTEASADFAAAVRLDPSYEFAANRLIDMKLSDGDWESADALRRQVPERDQAPYFLACGVRIDLHFGRSEAAAGTFHRLVRHPHADSRDLLGCLSALSSAGLADRSRETLLAAVRSGDARSHGVGEAAVHALADGSQWAAIEDLLAALSDKVAGGGSVRAADIACRAIAAYAERGGPERAAGAIEAARRLTVLCPEEPRAWLALANVLSGSESLEERLGAFDKAIALRPGDFESYELKAMALAEAGRHAEAREACADPRFGGRPPLELRGRAAWIAWHEGRREEALAAMEKLVNAFPGYLWGWRQLAEWHWGGDVAALRQAADALVRLCPHEPSGYGYRAEAEARAGRTDAAIKSLRRALDLDPEYEFGLRRLIDLLLERGNPAEAESLLRRLRALGYEAAAAARYVELWLAGGDGSSARSSLYDLCLIPNEGAHLSRALRAFERNRRSRWADEVLANARAGGKASPQMPEVWIEWLGSRRAYGRALRVAWACRNDASLRGPVTSALLNALTKGRARYRLLAFVGVRRRWLRNDAQTWGTVGYALLTLGYQRLSRWWLADWHERRDWEPWMLVNLVLACQAVGRFAQAATVAHEGHTAIRRALRGGAATELSLRYEVLVASEAAFAAPAEDALARLERIEPTALIPSEAFRLDLAKAVATARAGGQGAFGRSRTRLAAAVRASPQFHRIPWLRRCHRRAVFAIGREFGILGRLWGMGAATSWFWR